MRTWSTTYAKKIAVGETALNAAVLGVIDEVKNMLKHNQNQLHHIVILPDIDTVSNIRLKAHFVFLA